MSKWRQPDFTFFLKVSFSWRKSMKPTIIIWSGKVYQDKQGMLSLKKYPGYDENCVK